MRNSVLGLLFFTCLFVLDAKHHAGASCTADQNGMLTVERTAGVQMTIACTTNIEEQISRVIQIGVCESFPLQSGITSLADSIRQCQNMLTAPVDASSSIGASQAVEANAPAPGNYSYFYQLVSARREYKALWHFADGVFGGNGELSSQGQTGTWCTPPPFEYSTSTIFDGIYPSNCQNTEPASLAFSTLFFNNIGFSEWRGLMSVPVLGTPPGANNYEIDESAFQHVILVDENLNIIANEADKGDTAYVFALQKLSPALEIASGENLILQTTLTDKARAPLGCGADTAFPCSFNTPFPTLGIDLIVE
jgi:hypothetical protein